MTGGDRFEIDMTVGAGARLTVTTAAAEKIYRSLGPDTQVAVKAAIGCGGALAWLPQETILFDRVRLQRTIDINTRRGFRFVLRNEPLERYLQDHPDGEPPENQPSPNRPN